MYVSCIFPDKLHIVTSVSKTACALPIVQVSKQDILGASIQSAANVTAREKTRDYWKQVVVSHPDYEDAYIQVIILSYELRNTDDVQSYINLLRTRNPNHSMLKTLEGLVVKNVQ